MTVGKQKDETLRSALLGYFRDVVTIRKDEMSSAKELVMDFIDILRGDFQLDETDVNLKLEVGDPIFSGSVWEGLKAEDATEFDVVFPLMLNGDAWDCNKLADDSTSYGPYICYLKNGNHSKEDAAILRMYRDKSVMDKTLDPMRVKKAFRNEVINILEDHDDPKSENVWELADTEETSPAVTLIVHKSYTPDHRISLDLVPCLQIKKANEDVVLLVPKGDEGLYWRRSFSVQEKKLLKSIDGEDNGCRKKVLRILKAVSSKSRHTPLAYLDSYTLKNAIMHLHQSGDWSEENIAGCFKRVLSYLEDCFEKGKLPRYFERKHNILRNKTPVALENIAGFLRNIRESNDYIRLLRL